VNRHPLLFSWAWRRGVVIATLVFTAGLLIYISGWGRDTAANTAIANGFVLLIPIVVGTYVLGAVWDDRNARAEIAKLSPAKLKVLRAETPPTKLSVLSALPWTWQLAIGAGVVVLVLAVGGGLYLKGHADGDADGYARAQAYYTKLMADQAAANKAAIDAANKQLLETADQLAKTDKAYDDALAAIEASSGGAGADTGGLDQRRVHDLDTIK